MSGFESYFRAGGDPWLSLTVAAKPQDGIAEGESSGGLCLRLDEEVYVEVPLSISALDHGLEVGLGRRRPGAGDHGRCRVALKSRLSAKASEPMVPMSVSL